MATVFFIIQIIVGRGMNYGLYAVVFSISAAEFVYKYLKLRRRHELIVAIMYVIVVLMFSIAHIYQLLSSSVIL